MWKITRLRVPVKLSLGWARGEFAVAHLRSGTEELDFIETRLGFNLIKSFAVPCSHDPLADAAQGAGDFFEEVAPVFGPY